MERASVFHTISKSTMTRRRESQTVKIIRQDEADKVRIDLGTR